MYPPKLFAQEIELLFPAGPRPPPPPPPRCEALDLQALQQLLRRCARCGASGRLASGEEARAPGGARGYQRARDPKTRFFLSQIFLCVSTFIICAWKECFQQSVDRDQTTFSQLTGRSFESMRRAVEAWGSCGNSLGERGGAGGAAPVAEQIWGPHCELWSLLYFL